MLMSVMKCTPVHVRPIPDSLQVVFVGYQGLGCSMQLDQNAALNNDSFRIYSISVAAYEPLDCHTICGITEEYSKLRQSPPLLLSQQPSTCSKVPKASQLFLRPM